jgi:hypothetical protein
VLAAATGAHVSDKGKPLPHVVTSRRLVYADGHSNPLLQVAYLALLLAVCSSCISASQGVTPSYRVPIPEAAISYGQGAQSLDWGTNDREIAVGSSNSSHVYHIDDDSWVFIAEERSGQNEVIWTSSGEYLYGAGTSFWMWSRNNIQIDELLFTIPAAYSFITDVLISPRESVIALARFANAVDYTIYIYSLSSQQVSIVPTMIRNDWLQIEWIANDKLLVIGTRHGQMEVWDVNTLELKMTSSTSVGEVTDISSNIDLGVVAVFGTNRYLLLEISTLQPTIEVNPFADTIRDSDWCNSTLAIASPSSGLWIWDITNNLERRVASGGTRAVDWSRSQQQLAAAVDTEIQFWSGQYSRCTLEESASD